MDTKSLFASKIFWINLLTLVLALLAAATGDAWVASSPEVLKVLLAVSAAVNIGLRVLTKLPVNVFGSGRSEPERSPPYRY